MAQQIPSVQIISNSLNLRKALRPEPSRPKIFSLRTLQSYLNTVTFLWITLSAATVVWMKMLIFYTQPISLDWAECLRDAQLKVLCFWAGLFFYIRIAYFLFPDSYDDGNWKFEDDFVIPLGPRGRMHNFVANLTIRWNKKLPWVFDNVYPTPEEVHMQIPQFLTNVLENLDTQLKSLETTEAAQVAQLNSFEVYLMAAKLWAYAPPSKDQEVAAIWMQFMTQMSDFLVARERMR